MPRWAIDGSFRMRAYSFTAAKMETQESMKSSISRVIFRIGQAEAPAPPLCEVEFGLVEHGVAFYHDGFAEDLFDLLQVIVLIGLQNLGDFGINAQHHIFCFDRL